jgi:ribosome-binding factor A
MSRRKQKADEIRDLAAERGPEDGGDAREFHSRPWNAPKKAGRKSRQLCAQVKDALVLAFPACADPILQQLDVLGVEPAPHSGRLLVLVGVSDPLDRSALSTSLSRAAGFLRSEVSSAINRRKAPELVFELIQS